MWWEEEGRGNDTRNLLGVMAGSSGRQPANGRSMSMTGRRESRRRGRGRREEGGDGDGILKKM